MQQEMFTRMCHVSVRTLYCTDTLPLVPLLLPQLDRVIVAAGHEY